MLRKRIYTDADMYNAAFRNEMEDCLAHIDDWIKYYTRSTYQHPFPNNHELVVDFDIEDDGLDNTAGFVWQYYFVDHDNKCLFWLKDRETSRWFEDAISGVKSHAHFCKSCLCAISVYIYHVSSSQTISVTAGTGENSISDILFSYSLYRARKHWSYFPVGKRPALDTKHFRELSGLLNFYLMGRPSLTLAVETR
jgi:hypothetical protein